MRAGGGIRGANDDSSLAWAMYAAAPPGSAACDGLASRMPDWRPLPRRWMSVEDQR